MLREFGIYHFIVCVLLIISGIVCGCLAVNYIAQEGIINEENINLDYSRVKEHFIYTLVGKALENKGNGHYELNVDLDTGYKFDGSNNEYILKFNGSFCKKVSQTPTTITSEFSLEFYDLQETFLAESTIRIYISFFPERTSFKLMFDGTPLHNQLWFGYFADNGITLDVQNIGGVNM